MDTYYWAWPQPWTSKRNILSFCLSSTEKNLIDSFELGQIYIDKNNYLLLFFLFFLCIKHQITYLFYQILLHSILSALFTNGLFGCLKKEGEQSRGRESNSIILFGSFLRKEGGFGGVSTTSNISFLIPPNLRDLKGEQSR